MKILEAYDPTGCALRDQTPSLHPLADQTGFAVGAIQKAIRKLEQES